MVFEKRTSSSIGESIGDHGVLEMDVPDVTPGEMELAMVHTDEHSDRSKGDPKRPLVTRAERDVH